MKGAECRDDARATFSRVEERSRGFTLIEALVALTIVSMMLAAIANLSNVTVRGVVHVERSLAEVEIAQRFIATSPARGDLAALSSSGELDGHVWRLSAEPFPAPFLPASATPRWVPVKIKLSVRGRGGAPFDAEWVRLARAP